MVAAVQTFYEPVVWPDDAEAAVEFLASSEWPYHGRPNLSRDQAAEVSLAGADIVSFWVKAGSEAVGLIRVFDLEDLDVGSPLLDIRIAAAHRGRGVGTAAVSWLVDHLFTTYGQLHRIEPTTRHDNVPMQRVFDRCGFRLEGRMLKVLDERGWITSGHVDLRNPSTRVVGAEIWRSTPFLSQR